MVEILRLPRVLRNVGIEADVKGNCSRGYRDFDQTFNVDPIKLFSAVHDLRAGWKQRRIVREARRS